MSSGDDSECADMDPGESGVCERIESADIALS